MKSKNNIFRVLAVCIIWGCSKSDEIGVAAPELDYGQEIKAIFHTQGNSMAPEVNWHGDRGSFGLANAVEEFAIDPNTGVISWDKSLTVGNHDLQVIVFNNAGTTSLTVTIENRFSGMFEGSYLPAETLLFASDFTMTLTFNVDGTFTGYFQHLREGIPVDPSPYTGNWMMEGNIIQGEFNDDSTTNFTAFEAKLEQPQTESYLYGFLGSGETLSNPFEVYLIIE